MIMAPKIPEAAAFARAYVGYSDRTPYTPTPICHAAHEPMDLPISEAGQQQRPNVRDLWTSAPEDKVKQARGRAQPQITDKAIERRRAQNRRSQQKFRNRKQAEEEKLKDDHKRIRDAVRNFVNRANQYSDSLRQIPELNGSLQSLRALVETRESEESASENVHERSNLDDTEPIRSEESKDVASPRSKSNGQYLQLDPRLTLLSPRESRQPVGQHLMSGPIQYRNQFDGDTATAQESLPRPISPQGGLLLRQVAREAEHHLNDRTLVVSFDHMTSPFHGDTNTTLESLLGPISPHGDPWLTRQPARAAEHHLNDRTPVASFDHMAKPHNPSHA
ncbi:uncharacterized protein B0I36DRAFT_337866 [Microdochium trichocladiopsis]|uniref:BZIP domain-containing protein n=1 Tax=Microdochium trichocladiopsis TaxID=1682393 RepID=A0A9P8XTW9_9PEZI|nr:uncharacterized protein B0I36DRAFT_337866 [Microdochium trichocladiopsis]KAH7016489.1 hypothetical protein B0I36DRAFT_337866 [Microdochium trichocladiopsis]